MEEQARFGVERLRLLVKALAALVLAVGVAIAIAIIGLIRHAIAARGSSFAPIRLAFARYLTLALELQLAADILSTSVAPTWERIGKLAAIAIIRTALNYFLSLEIEAERRSQHGRLQDRTWSPSDLRAGRGLLNRGIGLRRIFWTKVAW
ncbi:DUF1622 domain-containing protein [Noviherbaspirillum malthae]|uniref:DUF1622 domain-containing protein n=1 Tax=Noviherbaspirillum malthae TaxID=1260987 RepID=UPI00188DD51F|nr:DUF1622 domain-containing protein [Noviherbaspirillum malthae]